MTKKVFLVAGGTGGHIFPAIALTERNKKYKYFFLVDKRTEGLVSERKIKYYKVFSARSPRNFFAIPISFIKIISGIFQSLILILKHRPSLIIGFGGYTSIPSLISAKMLGIKTLIHEQNAIMGKTNRILSLLSDKVAITFKTTKFSKSSSVHTGIPVRKIRRKKNIKKKGKVLLILGGSQGARIFSEILPKIIKNFNSDKLKNIIIIQQARKEDKSKLIKIYNELGVKYKIKTFFRNIFDEIGKSDVIISRCGSSTLAEIELFQKYSVLFPLPSSMDNHQHYNAMEFKKNNACEIVDERKINYSSLSRNIQEKLFFKKNLNFSNKTKQNMVKKPIEKLIDEILT